MKYPAITIRKYYNIQKYMQQKATFVGIINWNRFPLV